MSLLRVAVVVVLAFALLAAPRWWRMRRMAEQAAAAPMPDLPATLHSGTRTWVVFTTRFCAQCGPLTDWLRSARHGDEVVLVDAEREPDLAQRYRVRSTPTVVVADASGAVEARLVGTDAVRAYATA